jgi:hypothetical protein
MTTKSRASSGDVAAGLRLSGVLLDRRAFLGRAGLAAGVVAATALVPLSVVHALPGDVPLAAADPSGFGSADDACGHWPPYSHPIPYGRPAAGPSIAANVDPIDHIFLT